MKVYFRSNRGFIIPFVTTLLTIGIIVMGSVQASSHNLYREPGYVTITEGYDWGPAISTIILYNQFGSRISQSDIDKDDFSVYVTRKDPATGEVLLSYIFVDGEWQAIESKGYRTITDVYVSNSLGSRAQRSRFITIKMTVHPADVLPSVINYNFWTGLNSYINAEYEVSGYVNGQEFHFYNEDLLDNITLLVDDFDLDGHFTYDDAEFGTIELGYASYEPIGKFFKSPNKRGHWKRPLIVWLHGGGEGGVDTRIPLVGNKVANLASRDIQDVFGGAFVLVPQAPTMWMDSGTGNYADFDGTSKYTSALMALIDEYVDSHRAVDTDRIYVGGCSNGGFMSSRLTVDYPDYFAAAFPIAGTVPDFNDQQSDENIQRIKDIPMWLTQSEADTTVDPSVYTNPFYEKLIAAGATNIHYSHPAKVIDTSGLYYWPDGMTPWEYNGHWSWIYVLNNDPVLVDYDGQPVQVDGWDVTIMEWLSLQSRDN